MGFPFALSQLSLTGLELSDVIGLIRTNMVLGDFTAGLRGIARVYIIYGSRLD